jgi:GcrA cell cycle regulator
MGRRFWETDWDEQQVALLSQLWAKGHTTAQIGAVMRLSKNAIIGKVHRLGLPSRPSPIKRGAAHPAIERRSDSPPMKSTAHIIRLHTPQPMPRVASLAPAKYQAVRDCQFPTTPGRPYRFCAAPAAPGRVYCTRHVKVCYSQRAAQ